MVKDDVTQTDRHYSEESGSPESHFNRNYEKSAVRFWRTTAHRARRHSAVQCWP